MKKNDNQPMISNFIKKIENTNTIYKKDIIKKIIKEREKGKYKEIHKEKNGFFLNINKEIREERKFPLNFTLSNKVDKSITKEKINKNEINNNNNNYSKNDKNITLPNLFSRQIDLSKGKLNNCSKENFRVKCDKNNIKESKTTIKGFFKVINSISNKDNTTFNNNYEHLSNKNNHKKLKKNENRKYSNEINYSFNNGYNFTQNKYDFDLESDDDLFLFKPLTDRVNKRNEINKNE
jgi:hypothetical protein